jgi:hypothetical protein
VKLYDVTSSNVKQLGYNLDTQTVQVSFKDKAGAVTSIHQYWPIEEAMFTRDILNAPSVGNAVYRLLVKGTCERRKVS